MAAKEVGLNLEYVELQLRKAAIYLKWSGF